MQFLKGWYRSWVALVFLTSLCTSRAIILHDAPTAEERSLILQSARQTGDQLPGLGYAFGQRLDGAYTLAGSVVKLSSRIAISAAHASVHWSEGEYQKLWIGFGNYQDGLEGKETTYEVSTILRHPSLDLALYYFEEPLPGNVQDAVIYQDVVLAGRAIYFGGFGKVSHHGGSILSAGEKAGALGYLSAEMLLDIEVEEHYAFSLFTEDPTSPDHHSEGGLVDTWDSGGGVYIQDEFGNFQLIGIIEIIAGEREYGSYTGFLPLSHPGAYHFINRFLDSDGDGQSNLVEQAFSSDMFSSGSCPYTPLVLPSEGNGGDLMISHLALKDGTMDYTGQQSLDLINWQDAQPASNPSGLPVAPEQYEWKSWKVRPSSDRQFLRIHAVADLFQLLE